MSLYIILPTFINLVRHIPMFLWFLSPWYGGFHGHGGTPIAGWFLLGKLPSRNGWFGGTPILGNPHILKTYPILVIYILLETPPRLRSVKCDGKLAAFGIPNTKRRIYWTPGRSVKFPGVVVMTVSTVEPVDPYEKWFLTIQHVRWFVSSKPRQIHDFYKPLS